MKTLTTMDYVKASRKGSRDGEVMNSTGWASKHKVHKNAKKYSRKDSNKMVREIL